MKKIRIQPAGRVTDQAAVKVLAARYPSSFRKAQDVLLAARKYKNKSGLFSTDRSRVQSLQAECYQLERALESDGVAILYEGRADALIDFLSLFSDAFPNWQLEYETLSDFIPQVY